MHLSDRVKGFQKIKINMVNFLFWRCWKGDFVCVCLNVSVFVYVLSLAHAYIHIYNGMHLYVYTHISLSFGPTFLVVKDLFDMNMKCLFCDEFD